MTTATIDFLIQDLGSHDGYTARRAREKLEQIGAETIPALINVLHVGSARARWEAAKALENMPSPHAAEALVYALEDDSSDVRWLAAKALIKLHTSAYVPLLQALLVHPERDRLRKSAHHVLGNIFMMPDVKPHLMAVYTALDKNATASELRLVVADTLGHIDG